MKTGTWLKQFHTEVDELVARDLNCVKLERTAIFKVRMGSFNQHGALQQKADLP